MANEVMRTLSFHIPIQVPSASVVDFLALEEMTIVGVSICMTANSGSPTGFTVDIQDDGTDVIADITANTALTPASWKAVHMGGTNAAVVIAAGSEVEIDWNITGGSSPQAAGDVVIWYLAGDQG